MRAADLVREARQRAGLTQAELARRAKTSQPSVNRTERGVSEPSLPILRRLLQACGFRLELRLVKHQLPTYVERHRRDILAAARRRGVTEVRVFGSVARGDARAGSDVDFLVDLDPGRDIVDLAGFRSDLREILGRDVDVSTPDLLRPEVRREALSEAVPL
jgi:uncharacterized protein